HKEAVSWLENMPEGVTEIGDEAFSCCTSLRSVRIPKSVTYIGDEAFFGCTSLVSVSIPEGVTYIGDVAFCRCTSLASVTIPSSVTKIGRNAFQKCTSLASVTISEGVTYIGEDAFCDCPSLTSIVIPEGVTKISNSTFSYCTSLASVSIPESVTEIGKIAFWECTSLASVSIPKGIQKIYPTAFSAWTKIFLRGAGSQQARLLRVNEAAKGTLVFADSVVEEEPSDESIPEEIGGYKIIEKLSKSSRGRTYRAEHKELGGEYVIQEVAIHSEEERRLFNRILQQQQKKWDKNSAVRAYGSFTDSGHEYVVLEYVEGAVSLAELIKKQRGLPLVLAIEFFAFIYIGFSKTDDSLIAGMTSDNVLFSVDSEECSIDIKFNGLGAFKAAADRTSCLAPEQIDDYAKLDKKTLVYKMGLMMLYEMLFSVNPFSGGSDDEIKAKIKKGEFMRPHERDRFMPAFVSDSIVRVLEKDREKRFKNPEDVWTFLCRSLDNRITRPHGYNLLDVLHKLVFWRKDRLDFHHFISIVNDRLLDFYSWEDEESAAAPSESASLLLYMQVPPVVFTAFTDSDRDNLDPTTFIKKTDAHIYRDADGAAGMEIDCPDPHAPEELSREFNFIPTSYVHRISQLRTSLAEPGDYLLRIDFPPYVYWRSFSLKPKENHVHRLGVFSPFGLRRVKSVRMQAFDSGSGADITARAVFEIQDRSGNWIPLKEADADVLAGDGSLHVRASCEGYEGKEIDSGLMTEWYQDTLIVEFALNRLKTTGVQDGTPRPEVHAPAMSPAVAVAPQTDRKDAASGDADSETPGIRKIGRYEIIKDLAEGGMGKVSLAYDEDVAEKRKRKVVIKELIAGTDEDSRNRFKLELDILRELGSTYTDIVKTYDWFSDPDSGKDYIVMEFVEGTDLAGLLRQQGPLPPSLALYIIFKVYMGLKVAHDHGIIHRDIKPQNVFISRNGDVKLADFGIAKDSSEKYIKIDESGLDPSSLGSFLYMSPEQHRDASSVDAKADIFSLGVMLYEMLFGERPFMYNPDTRKECDEISRKIKEIDQRNVELKKDWNERKKKGERVRTFAGIKSDKAKSELKELTAKLCKEVREKMENGDYIKPSKRDPYLPAAVSSLIESLMDSAPEERPDSIMPELLNIYNVDLYNVELVDDIRIGRNLLMKSVLEACVASGGKVDFRHFKREDGTTADLYALNARLGEIQVPHGQEELLDRTYILDTDKLLGKMGANSAAIRLNESLTAVPLNSVRRDAYDNRVLAPGSYLLRSDVGPCAYYKSFDHRPEAYKLRLFDSVSFERRPKAIRAQAFDACTGADLSGQASFEIQGRDEAWIPLDKAGVNALSGDGSVRVRATCKGYKAREFCIGLETGGFQDTIVVAFDLERDTPAPAAVNEDKDFEIVWGVLSEYSGHSDSVTTPEGIHIIGEMAFERASARSVTISAGVTKIGLRAFRDCTSLESVSIPDSVTEIGWNAFSGCTSLSEIRYGGTKAQWDAVQKSVCWIMEAPVKSLICRDGPVEFPQFDIQGGVLRGYIGADSSVAIPDCVTEIGEMSFYHCTTLASVTIPASVTKIGGWAFKECMSLAEIRYTGTKAQWEAVKKESEWGLLVHATSVCCADGTAELEGIPGEGN
ncbi:MAG: leucine-rich repeat protein, partial [Treponema sp.]|nr:leucine-rich repeat protein [Treponema sp.]